MPIIFPCPNPTCESHVQRKKLTAKDELAGRTLPCPACKTQVTVLTALEQAEIDRFCAEEGYGSETTQNQKNWLLYKAIRDNRDFAVIHFLVSQDADVDAKCTNDMTPLHCAIAQRNVKVVKYLIPKVNDVIGKHANELTLLHLAACLGDEEVIKALVEGSKENHKELNINAKDNDGLTPLDYAKEIGKNDKVVDYLSKKGAWYSGLIQHD